MRTTLFNRDYSKLNKGLFLLQKVLPDKEGDIADSDTLYIVKVEVSLELLIKSMQTWTEVYSFDNLFKLSKIASVGELFIPEFVPIDTMNPRNSTRELYEFLTETRKQNPEYSYVYLFQQPQPNVPARIHLRDNTGNFTYDSWLQIESLGEKSVLSTRNSRQHQGYKDLLKLIEIDNRDASGEFNMEDLLSIATHMKLNEFSDE